MVTISLGRFASSSARWVCSGSRRGQSLRAACRGHPAMAAGEAAPKPAAGGKVGAGFGGWKEQQYQHSPQLCSCVDGCCELFPTLLQSTEAAHSPSAGMCLKANSVK